MFTDEEEQIREVIIASRKLEDICGENITENGILKNGEECLENVFKKLTI